MRDWKSLLAEALKLSVHQTERLLEGVSHRFRNRIGWTRPVQIIPFRGYGNSAEVFCEGRVMEERTLGTPKEDDAWWENALDMYRRFRARDIGGVRVQATCLGQTQETVTDDEGYYRFHINLHQPSPSDQLWHDVEIELLEQVREDQPEVRATGSVMIGTWRQVRACWECMVRARVVGRMLMAPAQPESGALARRLERGAKWNFRDELGAMSTLRLGGTRSLNPQFAAASST